MKTSSICQAHGINLPFDARHSYSRDRNYGTSAMKVLNWKILPSLLTMTTSCIKRSPAEGPDKETEITMTFEAGVPKTLNGKAMKVSEIITELNRLGGENGIGIVDIVENRVVGMKSRGVYETQAEPF